MTTHGALAIACVALLCALTPAAASATSCEGHLCAIGYAKYGWFVAPCSSDEQREALRPLLDNAHYVTRELWIADERLGIWLARDQWIRIMDAFSCPPRQ